MNYVAEWDAQRIYIKIIAWPAYDDGLWGAWVEEHGR